MQENSDRSKNNHLGTKRGLGFTNVRFFIRCCITADTGGRTTLVGGPAWSLALGLPPLRRFFGLPRRRRVLRVFGVLVDSGCSRRWGRAVLCEWDLRNLDV